MGRFVQHKESLPAQVGIKRRRPNPAAPDSAERTQKVEQPTPNETENDLDKKAHSTSSLEEEEDAASIAEEVSSPSPSSSSSEEEDDDEMELEKERQRIEQMRSQKQRTRNEEESYGNGTKKEGGIEGSVASYNHDVLFRRRDWRERGVTTAGSEAERKKAKWDAVQNNAQNSVSFRHFIKKHFK